VSPQQTKFAANPGRMASSLFAEAMDSELAVVDGGKEASVIG
jgi:hypothetical protein